MRPAERRDHNGRYVLGGRDGRTPIAEPDLLKWAGAMELTGRHVALTPLPFGGRVSTVFLGLDHSFGHGPPLLFETMTFFAADGCDAGGYFNRYSTWAQAEAGHARIVFEVRRDIWTGRLLLRRAVDAVRRRKRRRRAP